MGQCGSHHNLVSSSSLWEGTANKEEVAETPPLRTHAIPRRIPFVTHEYGFGPSVGSGSTASVLQAVCKKDGQTYAVKVFDKHRMSPFQVLWLKEEVAILQSLRHPHIVRIYDFLEDHQAFYVVMELVKGGELQKRLKAKGKYSEKEARAVFLALMTAVKHLHDRDIVHRDLKPANLLLTNTDDDTSVKIADFGFATRMFKGDNSLQGVCGTVLFIAPEILKMEKYGKAVDMWSLGVVLYLMLAGHQPFYHKCPTVLKAKIMRGEYDFEHFPANVSQEAKDLIRRLLVVDPSHRLNASQALNHPWLKEEKSGATTTPSTTKTTSSSPAVLLKAAVARLRVLQSLPRAPAPAIKVQLPPNPALSDSVRGG